MGQSGSRSNRNATLPRSIRSTEPSQAATHVRMDEEPGASVLLKREIDALLARTYPIVEKLRAVRQGAADGQGHGRIAVATGRADAHALTDQLEKGGQVSLKVTGLYGRLVVCAPPSLGAPPISTGFNLAAGVLAVLEGAHQSSFFR
jgi:hypothetical protein